MKSVRHLGYLATIPLLATLLVAGAGKAANTLKIGVNLPLSGIRESAGNATRLGAEMVREAINAKGGLQIGSTKYTIEYVFTDNRSDPQQAVTNALKLITQDQVLGIIGPIDSSKAIPAGGICESFKTPMVSPTSTNPQTTLNRPYVFRACFLDPFQGEAMAGFASEELKATKAAVLYNAADAYPRGLAEYFTTAFEQRNGAGSVVAVEKFLPSETDHTARIGRIISSGAEVLFLPQYDNEVPAIARQARTLGWDKVILGGDAWQTAELMPNCGDACKGSYFSSHFTAVGAKGHSQEFVQAFQAKFNELPTGDAALGYDTANLLLSAIGSLNRLSGNILEDRAAVKDRLASLKGFAGVSGTLDMTAGGDPIKSAVIIRINDQGEFASHTTQTP